MKLKAKMAQEYADDGKTLYDDIEDTYLAGFEAAKKMALKMFVDFEYSIYLETNLEKLGDEDVE